MTAAEKLKRSGLWGMARPPAAASSAILTHFRGLARFLRRALTDRAGCVRGCKRAAAAGIAEEICCHTFRATGITAYLANGGALEHAQEMAAHESPRTTKLYDRTKERLTQDEVERIRL